MRKTLIVFLVAASFICHAQRASIKKVELAGEKIIVHYDLEDSNPAHLYQINLYASQNNFSTALTRVAGDVGSEIAPGANKKIEWRIREELGPFKGKISLEIRGRMVIPVAKINNIARGQKFKRGRRHLITWKAGNDNPVNIALLKNGEPVSSQAAQPNNGSYTLFIPIHTAPGQDYAVRITDTEDPQNTTTSQQFAVTRKVPLLLKALPVIAVGGVVTFLLGGDSGGGQEDPGNNDGIIELPDYPN